MIPFLLLTLIASSLASTFHPWEDNDYVRHEIEPACNQEFPIKVASGHPAEVKFTIHAKLQEKRWERAELLVSPARSGLSPSIQYQVSNHDAHEVFKCRASWSDKRELVVFDLNGIYFYSQLPHSSDCDLMLRIAHPPTYEGSSVIEFTDAKSIRLVYWTPVSRIGKKRSSRERFDLETN